MSDPIGPIQSTDNTPSGPKVLFVNNAGGGFADWVAIVEGVPLEDFLIQKLPGGRGEAFTRYRISVNGQVADRRQPLKNDDRISVTPLKVEAAR